jgi:hypothetical protein
VAHLRVMAELKRRSYVIDWDRAALMHHLQLADGFLSGKIT